MLAALPAAPAELEPALPPCSVPPAPASALVSPPEPWPAFGDSTWPEHASAPLSTVKHQPEARRLLRTLEA